MWKTFLGGCWKNKVVVISLYICWIDFLRITSGTKGNTLIWSFEPNLETESGIEAGILEEKRVTSHLWIRFVARLAAFVVYCSFLVKWQEFIWGNFCGFWVESQCKHVRQRRRFSQCLLLLLRFFGKVTRIYLRKCLWILSGKPV